MVRIKMGKKSQTCRCEIEKIACNKKMEKREKCNRAFGSYMTGCSRTITRKPRSRSVGQHCDALARASVYGELQEYTDDVLQCAAGREEYFRLACLRGGEDRGHKEARERAKADYAYCSRVLENQKLDAREKPVLPPRDVTKGEAMAVGAAERPDNPEPGVRSNRRKSREAPEQKRTASPSEAFHNQFQALSVASDDDLTGRLVSLQTRNKNDIGMILGAKDGKAEVELEGEREPIQVALKDASVLSTEIAHAQHDSGECASTWVDRRMEEHVGKPLTASERGILSVGMAVAALEPGDGLLILVQKKVLSAGRTNWENRVVAVLCPTPQNTTVQAQQGPVALQPSTQALFVAWQDVLKKEFVKTKQDVFQSSSPATFAFLAATAHCLLVTPEAVDRTLQKELKSDDVTLQGFRKVDRWCALQDNADAPTTSTSALLTHSILHMLRQPSSGPSTCPSVINPDNAFLLEAAGLSACSRGYVMFQAAKAGEDRPDAWLSSHLDNMYVQEAFANSTVVAVQTTGIPKIFNRLTTRDLRSQDDYDLHSQPVNPRLQKVLARRRSERVGHAFEEQQPCPPATSAASPEISEEESAVSQPEARKKNRRSRKRK